MNIHTGIAEEARQDIAHGLSRVLADIYVLYVKTHAFHWNVEGPMFQTLHVLFEQQYTELWQALDEVAERIRALGEKAPGTYAEFRELSRIPETEGAPVARDMIRLLLEGREQLAQSSRELLPKAQEATDEVTAGLLTDRLTIDEKTAWMLRSLLVE